METKNIGLEEILRGIEPVDSEWIEKAKERTAQLVMPTRALGRLHDISTWQEILEKHPEILDRKIVKPSHVDPIANKEGKEQMNKEYLEMLLHTVYEVAKIVPISDMMDEYLYGRLEGAQKELFEKHLFECNECYEKFKERKTIISALKPVLDDIEGD